MATSTVKAAGISSLSRDERVSYGTRMEGGEEKQSEGRVSEDCESASISDKGM